MTENHTNLNETSAKADASTVAKARHANRRRMLKAAAIAAPLMITLRGKSAHAQLSSLGSAGIMYGPGAYVTQADINLNANDAITQGDLGKALKEDNGKLKVLNDQTRRDQKSVESGKEFTRP